MNWIKRKVIKWVREDWDNEAKKNSTSGSMIKSIEDAAIPDAPAVLSFRIYGAANGKVVEFRSYNQKTDRSTTNTYIVPEGEDVGDLVKSCLPMEMLKVE